MFYRKSAISIRGMTIICVWSDNVWMIRDLEKQVEHPFIHRETDHGR